MIHDFPLGKAFPGSSIPYLILGSLKKIAHPNPKMGVTDIIVLHLPLYTLITKHVPAYCMGKGTFRIGWKHVLFLF